MLDDATIVLAAADPVNLCGIITDEPRVPSTHTNTVAILNGRLIAACQAGEVQWFAAAPEDQIAELARRLRLHYYVPDEIEDDAEFSAFGFAQAKRH